jgi:hypothetical protein
MELAAGEVLPAMERREAIGTNHVDHTVWPAIGLVIALQRLTI